MKKNFLLSILCAISIIAMAQNGYFTVDGKKYQLLGGDSVELIDGYTGSTYYNYQVSIPETIHVNINNQTYYGQEISGDYRVVSIGVGAFETDNSSPYGRLSSVFLPKSIRKIGKNAFKNTYLEEFEIPLNVDSIGENAFSGCTKLKTIYNCSKNFFIQGGSSEYGGVGAYATEVYNNVVEVDYLTDLVWCRDSIAYFLARHVKNYRTYITLPQEYNGETYYIADNAFKNKNNLKKIVIPEGPFSMGKSVFSGCTALKYISLPASMTKIGENAFTDCEALDTIIVAEGNPQFDSRSNCNCLINSLTQTLLVAGSKSNIVPDGVKIIDNNAFAKHKFLTNIQLPLSIEHIGYNAFAECTNLTTINIPDGVKQISSNTFNGCVSLSKIDLPKNLTAIGNSAFYNCEKLSSLVVPCYLDSIGRNAFYGCKSLKTIYNFSKLLFIRLSQEYGNIAAYADEVYNNVDEMDDEFLWIKESDLFVLAKYFGHNSSLSLPDTHKGLGYRLGDNLFNGNVDLRIISLSENTFSIGSYVFYGCSNLNNINLPFNIDSIGDAAFSGCTSLTSVTIPNSVKSVGDSAFHKCSNLTSVNISNSIASIGKSVFGQCGRLASVSIPNSVTSIGESAFQYCGSLTSISIPNSVTDIGSYAFNCTGLESITIPNSITIIGESVFGGCRNMSTVSIPNSVTAIRKLAFENCTGLTSIIIPNSVTSIGNKAFSGCTGLTSVNIPHSVTSIGLSAFENCTGLTSVNLPNSITIIYDKVFSGCSSLRSISIPNGVTSIGYKAFYNCTNLKSVAIPNSVTNIYDYAFANCTRFDDITCYATTVPTITTKTFDNVGNKQYIYLYVPADCERAYKRDTYWGQFDIQIIGAKATETTEVNVTPSETTAEVVWPAVEGAATYELVVKDKDGNVICTLIFNANGQLTQIAFGAPAREQSAGFSFTVTGLEEGNSYDLTITAKNDSGATLDEKSVSFSTGGAQGLENVKSATNTNKILRDGHIYILRGDHTYTVTGQAVR